MKASEHLNELRYQSNMSITKRPLNSVISESYYRLALEYKNNSIAVEHYIFYYPPQYIAIAIVLDEEEKKNIYSYYQDEVQKLENNFNNTNCYFGQIKITKDLVYQDAIKWQYAATTPKTSRKEASSMAIVICENKVLLLKNQDEKHVIPKGHIETGETSIEAAIRECFEETGVTITKSECIGSLPQFSYSFNGANFKYLTNQEFNEIFRTNRIDKTVDVFVFEINDFRKPNVTERYFTGCEWIELENSNLAHDYDQNRIRQAFSLRKGEIWI